MTMPQRWMIRPTYSVIVVAAVCCCWLPGWVPWCVAVGRVALAGSAILGAPMVRLQESCYCNDMLLLVAPPSTILTMPSHYLASLSNCSCFFLPVVFVVVFFVVVVAAAVVVVLLFLLLLLVVVLVALVRAVVGAATVAAVWLVLLHLQLASWLGSLVRRCRSGRPGWLGNPRCPDGSPAGLLLLRFLLSMPSSAILPVTPATVRFPALCGDQWAARCGGLDSVSTLSSLPMA